MNKAAKFTYKGMVQDIATSKHPFEFYFEGRNIRIVTTGNQETGAVSNEKGNSLVLKLPSPTIDLDNFVINYDDKQLSFFNKEIENQTNITPNPDCNVTNLPINSGGQIIIGHTTTRDSLILFTTDNNGFDCIWQLKDILTDTYDLELLYVRNLGFSTSNPIQAIFNFETEIIQKIYWVDGINQLRFININHSVENGDLEELIDLNSSNINIIGDYSLSQPIIDEVSQNGTHTAGMIQYAYNLYKLNGSQTTISPLSELISLDFGPNLGGGEVNETVSAAPIVKLENLDDNYTHIKLYSIKYTSLNQLPQISLILDEEINDNRNLNYIDLNNIISTLSLSEFLFLGSNLYIPQHIEAKDNRLFSVNLKDKPFLFEIDARAFSFDDGTLIGTPVSILSESSGGLLPNGLPGGVSRQVIPDFNILPPPKYDCINSNYDIFKYQSNGLSIGGEGKYLKYEIIQQNLQDTKYLKFFKDSEIYRLGIQFYNKLGQKSFPLWIADFRAPEGNLLNEFSTLKVELKNEFYTYIDTLCEEDKPVGYKIIRADRTGNDKTIVCQGASLGMMVQTTEDILAFKNNISTRREKSKELVKLPVPISRGFESNINPIGGTEHLSLMSEVVSGYPNDISNNEFAHKEIFSSGNRLQQTCQFTKLFNMYSPEVLFKSSLTFSPGDKIRIKGIVKNTRNDIWEKAINTNNLNTERSNKFNVDSATQQTIGFHQNSQIQFLGLFGPAIAAPRMNQNLFNREYLDYIQATTIETVPIYGIPEIAERGQGTVAYNGDAELEYTNSMTSFLTDSTNNNSAITTMNSYHARCLVLSQGTDNSDLNNRKTLEELSNYLGLDDKDGLLMLEIQKPNEIIYGGAIYGGNTYESKSRSKYIEIGNYEDINNNTTFILSPGDTFVQNFKIARLSKTDTQLITRDALQVTEYIKFPVETTINLLNRNDNSRFEWDADFDPRYDEIHKYNNVYSQQANLIQNTAVSFKFKKVDNFNARIIASKVKIPNESIDSWTDFLENEILDLDGKYGSVNSIINFRDDLYTIQDEAIAKIIINPRVQVQASDGLSLELGTGGILYDYQYLTTTSGSLNKWSTVVSPTGFYYLDTFNKAWKKVKTGQGIVPITDLNGFFSYFQNNLDYNNLELNNPILKVGATSGFNFADNNCYLTIFNDKKSFTINFNERNNSLESFWDFKPTWYINKGKKLFTTHPDNNRLYEHGIGNYQTYYDVKYPSYIILQVNPEADLDCVFNNIEFKSELYLDNFLDVPNSTLTHITAYNEYQSSSRIPLVLNNNLKRRFRNWRANIPRESGSRNRIRNPWIFLKLELDTKNNYKFILHDIIVHYTI